MSPQKIISSAVQTLSVEAQGLAHLEKAIDKQFAGAVQSIIKAGGRVVVTGIGKSAIVAQKAVATFNSTGTPAIFMHAADAVHGDLGIIQPNDAIICISNSGNTPEIKLLAPILRTHGHVLIAITGNTQSVLASSAHYVINAAVPKEACPHNLAPTTSTTGQMALCDALAVCLLQCRGFSRGDFARVHPGGALGKQLLLTIGDIYIKNPKPAVLATANVMDVIMEITTNRMGATAVVKGTTLIGMITDGDLRRMMQQHKVFVNKTAAHIMTKHPKTIVPHALAVDAFNLMKQSNIMQLVVVNGAKYVGMVHMHDLLTEGIF